MNSRTAEWRPGPSVCRCCLAEGCYKDISTEYFWMGRREVYAEMLAETFDLTIAYSKSTGPNSNSRLICEACIARLRDAANFKKQVSDCERTFHQHLDPASTSSIPSLDETIEPLGTSVKIEESDDVKEEHIASDDDDMVDDVPDFGDDDDDDDDLDNQPLTRLASKTPKKEAVDITDLLDNAKGTVKRKSTSKAKASPAKKAKPAKKEKVSAKAPKPPKKKKGEAPHCLARRNAQTLVSYTTAYPFRLPNSAPMCVYCDEVLSDFAAFRKHMDMEHKTFWLPGAFSHLLPESYLKVDITDLKCRICQRCFETLDEIAEHMNECHIHKIDLDYELGLHPFKFTDALMSCVLCEQNFSCIRMLSRHMFSHYTKYVCEECGNKFSTSGSLNHHTRFVHTLGTCVCRKCKKTFPSEDERRQHQQSSEKCFKYRCSYCPRRFFSYVVKQRHQVEEHGDQGKEQHECPECKLVLRDIKAYYRHFNSVHSGAHFECSICGRTFGNMKDLRRHGAVHATTRDHHCPICSKSFTRKDYLKQHMRSHIAKKK